MVRLTSRSIRRAFAVPTLAVALGLAGCSDDGPVPICTNCEFWDQMTAGLARYPTPHPINASVLAYSTIEKTPGAPDANRQGDEDIWMTWVVDRSDPSANSVWQITGEELGEGGKFQPKWSPSGTQILFVAVAGNGDFDVWRVPVTVPVAADQAPVIGTPEMLFPDGRDPEWLGEDQILFSRDDKIFIADIPMSGAATAVNQLSFDPPIYATSESFVDRQPAVSPTDSEDAMFHSLGRTPVADIFVEAFEVVAADTMPTSKPFLFLQQPDASASYPLFEGADTLRTPVLLQSLPVGSGGNFVVGARIDDRFLAIADSLQETYCDTTLTQVVPLAPGDSDSVSFYFDVVRGTLAVTSGLSNTSFFWTRADLRLDSDDFPGIPQVLTTAGDTTYYECIMSYQISGGEPIPPALEDFVVTGMRQGQSPVSFTVNVTPSDTTVVELYPSGEPGAVPARASVAHRGSDASDTKGAPGGIFFGRAEGDVSTLWRIDYADPLDPELTEILGTRTLAQAPAISPDFGGIRYVAWTQYNTEGRWDLWVQKLTDWVTDGDPYLVPTPGSLENLSCDRSLFYPRWLPDSQPGQMRLAVTMTDCPDNAFPDSGPDDDPWVVGSLRLWSVELLDLD